MTFLSWNIHGLYKKLDDSDFLNYLYSFHVVCLTETYITDFMTLSWLTGYRLFFAPAVKLSTHGRHSGGVCVCVRQHIANKCVELKTEMNNIVCLKFHRSVFNLPNDLFLVCIYVPPVNSPFYDRSTDSRCLIDGLESLLLDNWSDMSTSHVLLCGDFNARTSNENNPIYEDRDEFGNDDVYIDVDNDPVDQRVYIRTLQRGSPPVSSISQTEWFCHFRDLFYKDDIIYDAYDDTIDTDNGCNEFTDVDKFLLESPITESEIVSAVSRLKVGKSAGVDAVISEMIKTALPVIMPFLVKSYNRVFDSRCFPSEWAKSIIVPLFKNGNINNPNNYRGISLTSVVGKSFVSIINNRLTQWSNMRDLIPDAQAGFRKEHSTFDHIFTVYSVIERYLAFRKRKFYVAFVDFRKAFDSVDRDKMWKCLRNRGLKGKMFDIIRSMYSKVKSCVRCDNVLSDYFDCPTGVRQGCVLSPLLFSFFYQRTIF